MVDRKEEISDDGQLFWGKQDDVRRPILRLFSEYGSNYKLLILVGIAGSVIGSLISLLPPYVLQTAIDAVLLENEPFQLLVVEPDMLPAERMAQLYLVAVVIVCAAVIGALFNWFSGWAWGRFAQDVQHTVRVDTYEKAQSLNMSFFESEQTGQIMSILNDDVRELNNVFSQFLGNAATIVATVVGVGTFLFVLHWEFALISFVFVPTILVTTRYFVRLLKPKHEKVRQHLGAVNSRIENNVSGMHVIKSYTQEAYETERMNRSSRKLYDTVWEVIAARIKFYPIISLLNWFGFTVLLIVGGMWIIDGPPLFFSQELTAGTLVAFLIYHQRLTDPFVEAGELVDKYYEARAAALRVLALHDHDERPDPTELVQLDSLNGHIRFENVSFDYQDTKPALKDIDVEISPGTFVGIVGSTGSGKSTLMKLLLRFYDPNQGAIRIDGYELENVEAQSLRANIGVVHQELYLFTGTIKENIVYGSTNAIHDDIVRAAKLANAHEFIQELPDGYDTHIGQQGAKLSGGQRQRIGLARALVSDPDILLLDEATSHVDNETEMLIQESLSNIVVDRTTFTIAHRLSTVRDADKILVLDDGRIVERGTHRELLQQEGKYAKLWNIHVGDIKELQSM